MGKIGVRMLLAFVVAAASAATLPALCAGEQQERPEEGRAAADKWERHYYERVARFEQENSAARNIVMVGSSHIEGFDAARLLPGRRVVNRGIAADRIGIGKRGVLHRLDNSVFDCNPGFIILNNGANDLGELWRYGRPSIDEIEACYREVVKRIRTGLPEVPLLIVGLFPTRDKYADLVPLVVEFNDRLQKIASEFGCPYLDVYPSFADADGLLRKEFSREGLHLTEAGYALWAGMIEKALSRPSAAATDPKGGGS